MRELAMNLVMHRNYQTNSPAKFYEYPDRIEMDNPGNLYGKVRPDNFPNENDYRNPVIAEAMKTLGYINRFSRGVNMVQETLEGNKNGLAEFVFDDITTFKVIVKNADAEAENEAENKSKLTDNHNDIKTLNIGGAENGAEKLSEREIEIMNLIQKDHTITRRVIATKLGIGTTTVYRDIESLKSRDFIERVGGDKGGYWKIK